LDIPDPAVGIKREQPSKLGTTGTKAAGLSKIDLADRYRSLPAAYACTPIANRPAVPAGAPVPMAA